MNFKNLAGTGVRAEDELLVCSTRLRPESETTSRLQTLLQSPLDWDYLLWAAHQHGLVPRLYRFLRATCPQDVPPAAMAALQDAAKENAARGLFLTGELLKILSVFQSQGVLAVPFKGPALAAWVYGDPAMRQFCDLDILVRREDFPRAKNLLVSLGYRPCPALPDDREAAYLKKQYEYKFVHAEEGNLVELHLDISPHFLFLPVDSRTLWENLEPWKLAGKTVLTFQAEDLLLFLCVHHSKHLWGGLGWISDVGFLVETHPGMDWEKVMASAASLGCRRMLFLGLLLAQDLLGAVIPMNLQEEAHRDAVVQRLARWVRKRLFRPPGFRYAVIETFPFHLMMRERWRDKLSCLIHLPFSPGADDWVSLPLPLGLAFFYSLLRPFRLFRKYVLGKNQDQ